MKDIQIGPLAARLGRTPNERLGRTPNEPESAVTLAEVDLALRARGLSLSVAYEAGTEVAGPYVATLRRVVDGAFLFSARGAGVSFAVARALRDSLPPGACP